MRLNNELYETLIAEFRSALKDDVRPSSPHDPLKELCGAEYTDNVLTSYLHCNREDYRTQEALIRFAFSGGFLAQILEFFTDGKETEIAQPEEMELQKMEFLSSVLSGSVYAMEGRLVGLLLVSDADEIKDHYKKTLKVITDCCQCLTYQNIFNFLTASAEDCWTGLYAVFSIAWDIKIDYHI